MHSYKKGGKESHTSACRFASFLDQNFPPDKACVGVAYRRLCNHKATAKKAKQRVGLRTSRPRDRSVRLQSCRRAVGQRRSSPASTAAYYPHYSVLFQASRLAASRCSPALKLFNSNPKRASSLAASLSYLLQFLQQLRKFLCCLQLLFQLRDAILRLRKCNTGSAVCDLCRMQFLQSCNERSDILLVAASAAPPQILATACMGLYP